MQGGWTGLKDGESVDIAPFDLHDPTQGGESRVTRPYMVIIDRGEVVVDLPPSQGGESRVTRPYMVIIDRVGLRLREPPKPEHPVTKWVHT